MKNISQKYPEVILMDGIPRNIDQPLQIFSPEQDNSLIFFDDLSSETQNSKAFTNFLVKGTHHSNVCCVSLEHHLFSDARERRRQQHHWHQIILFRNKRSQYQIGVLARQSSIANLN